MLLGLALTGVTVLIFTSVAGRTAGVISGGCALALFAVSWLFVPLLLRTRGRQV
ncbi:hypothetical protein ACX9NE_10125 [Mycobacterium sp. ML4]